MTDMKRVGGQTPDHRSGHCHYSPRLDGNICNAPADWHLWMFGPDSPDAFCAFVCDEHREIAYEILEPTDWHEVGDACIGRQRTERKWRFSGESEPGFCYIEGEEAEALAAVLELVTAHPQSTNSQEDS